MSYGRRDNVNITPTCYECKVPMVRRKGKFGDFFGCTNYPDCMFTSKTRFVKGNNDKPTQKDPGILPGDFNTRKG